MLTSLMNCKINYGFGDWRSHLHITDEQSKKNQPKSCNDYGKNYFSNISACGKILSQGTADINLHTLTKKALGLKYKQMNISSCACANVVEKVSFFFTKVSSGLKKHQSALFSCQVDEDNQEWNFATIWWSGCCVQVIYLFSMFSN